MRRCDRDDLGYARVGVSGCEESGDHAAGRMAHQHDLFVPSLLQMAARIARPGEWTTASSGVVWA